MNSRGSKPQKNVILKAKKRENLQLGDQRRTSPPPLAQGHGHCAFSNRKLRVFTGLLSRKEYSIDFTLLGANYVAQVFSSPGFGLAWPCFVEAVVSCLDEILAKLHQQIKEKQGKLLECFHGNPRSIKRICNILMVAVSFRENIDLDLAKRLFKVIVMVEQWPFR